MIAAALDRVAGLLGVKIATLAFCAGLFVGGAVIGGPLGVAGHWLGREAGHAAGVAEAALRCEAEAERAKLAAALRDLEAQRFAARKQAEAALANAQAAADAQKRIQDYEQAARARPDRACRRADADDVRRLLPHAGAPADRPPAPPRR